MAVDQGSAATREQVSPLGDSYPIVGVDAIVVGRGGGGLAEHQEDAGLPALPL